ncbi:hypothetical protein KIPB_001256 [Kipferlia bialata]|uniref:Thioredoxin domain-containing protein n=1 Tax=Kipferlia bialata TaxID=797122 RepID=A0A9K3CNN8_9EUKA|nr:hypothetical protein KIPB_001256 [Kipferlia bialata]|eukprot:g1256.t1
MRVLVALALLCVCLCDIVALTHDNIQETMNTEPSCFIRFSSAGCRHVKVSEYAFGELDKALAESHPDVPVYDYCCDDNVAFCLSKVTPRVGGYPAFYHFRDGVTQTIFKDLMTRSRLLTWAENALAQPTQPLDL